MSLSRSETDATSLCFGALALRPTGGLGVSTYIHQMLPHIGPFVRGSNISAEVQEDAVSELPKFIRVEMRAVSQGAKRTWQRLSPGPRVDVFHGLYADVPVTGPKIRVATVHDLSVFDIPEAFTRYKVANTRPLIRTAMRRADLLISVSKFTAERIKERFGRESTVVPLAAADWAQVPTTDEVAAMATKHRLPSRYLFQVGNLEPRKRTNLAVAIARALDIPLVLAGPGSAQVRAPGVHGLGFVEADDLPGLYAGAAVVTFTSAYEGFGLPPLEAMACGAAVVSSSVGGLPTVVRDGAVLVRSNDPDVWARAMRPLIEDKFNSADIRKRAVLAAEKLSWENTAQATVAAYWRAGIVL
jgi:glycosyltransferase involved in cell wall biosynthesis